MTNYWTLVNLVLLQQNVYMCTAEQAILLQLYMCSVSNSIDIYVRQISIHQCHD